MKCKKCKNTCIKNGFQKNGVQRYLCTICNKSQQQVYKYNACRKNTNTFIVKLLVNSCGIRDISRILNISKTTVLSRILLIAKKINWRSFYEYYQEYEVDELSAKISTERCWITYAINRKTKQIINFSVGNRIKESLNKVIKTLILLQPKRIYTDKLPSYKSLIPSEIHNTRKYQTNSIERFNLNLRTHLKRLSRKTICYSKNSKMLRAIIKIYFWVFNTKQSCKIPLFVGHTF